MIRLVCMTCLLCFDDLDSVLSICIMDLGFLLIAENYFTWVVVTVTIG